MFADKDENPIHTVNLLIKFYVYLAFTRYSLLQNILRTFLERIRDKTF